MADEKEGDEAMATVSVKVFIGNNSFREYRLPKSLTTDRSSLWRRKCEIGQRVAEVLKKKKTQINEHQAKIKKLEKSCENWKTIAKSITEDNENFFLDALLASEEDIERFECENFHKSNSWSKVRKTSAIPMEQRVFPGVSHPQSSASAENCNSDHYHWVLQKTNATSSTSNVANGVENPNCVTATVLLDVHTSATTNFVDEKENAEVTIKTTCPVEIVTKTISEQNNQRGSIQEDQCKQPSKCENESKKAIETTNGRKSSGSQISKDTQEICTGTSSNGNVQLCTPDEYNTVIRCNDEVASPHPEAKPLCQDIKFSLDKNYNTSSIDSTDIESLNKNVSKINPLHLSVDFPELTTASSTKIKDNVLSNVAPQSKNGKSEEDQANPNRAQEANQQEIRKIHDEEISREQNSSKKIVIDSCGPRLRLTSTSDQNEVVQNEPATAVKVENVWLRRAAEREKLKSENEPGYSISASPLTVFAPKPYVLMKPQLPVVKKDVQVKQERKPTPPVENNSSTLEQTVQAPKSSKIIDANGWTTLSCKKSKPRDTNSKTSKLSELLNTAVETNKVQSSMTSAKNEIKSKERCEQNNQMKPVGGNSDATNSSMENEMSSKNSELLEKRTRRRQRVQNKNKEKAKQAKEKEKITKELLRVKQEEKLAEIKRQKKEDQDREFFQKKQEMEAIRKLREEAERLKIEDCEEALKDVFDCRNRMNEYLKTKQIAYRLVACNCYIASRLKELESDKKFDANANKKNTILEYNAQLKNLQWKNTHMMFISSQMTEKNKTFKLDDLLAYVHNDHYQVPIEHMSVYQRKVRAAFDEYCKNHKCDPSEHMVKAIQFADGLINKMSAIENKTVPYENALIMLRDYKELHHSIFDFLGIATYLRTRREHPMFVLEEDYLLNIQRFEGEDNANREHGLRQVVAAMRAKQFENKKKDEQEAVAENDRKDDNETDFRNNDEKEKEIIIMKNAYSQTDREPYDVIAATYVPKEN